MTSSRHQTAALAVGSAVSGLLAYLLFALTTRALGVAAAGPVSVLWSYWAFAGAAITFPLQHWVARTIVAHGEGAVRHNVPRLVAVLVVLSVLAGALAWLLREPLFHRPDLWFPAMVAAVTFGSGAIGGVRGGLSARGRFKAVGWSLVAENGLRCLCVAVLILTGDDRVVAYGLCLVAGHLVAIWPSALRLSNETTDDEAPNALGFLASASLAQLIGQCVLTGGPVVLALAGGTPRQVTTLFVTLALFRAPYILALGMVAQLTTRVTALVVDQRFAVLSMMRQRLRVATAVVVVLAVAGGAWLGPFALQLVFGEDVVIGSLPTAVVAAGCAIAVANLLVMVSALAQSRSSAVARAWLLAVTIAALAFAGLVTADQGVEDAVVWSFLVAEVLAFFMLSAVEQRATSSARLGRSQEHRRADG